MRLMLLSNSSVQNAFVSVPKSVAVDTQSFTKKSFTKKSEGKANLRILACEYEAPTTVFCS